MNFFALSNEVPPDSLRSDSPPLKWLGEVKEVVDPGYITVIKEFNQTQKEISLNLIEMHSFAVY